MLLSVQPHNAGFATFALEFAYGMSLVSGVLSNLKIIVRGKIFPLKTKQSKTKKNPKP